ncbi:MAG: hypothetical protein IEMM0008_0035 [bacterium]|nr:MAG: hypothetical protein IEMM0008_0035 [bacterium]
MRAFKIIVLAIVALTACSSETVKSDIYVKPNYPISRLNKVLVGHFSVRTHVPYAHLNFREQLEFHLLQRKYKVLPDDILLDFYKSRKRRRSPLLSRKEIRSAHGESSFDLFIQGIIYEEDRSIFEEGNHIIVHIYIYSARGVKISTIRYIYTGERSLISGELIDESIIKMLSQWESRKS